jgi:ATP-binding cassette, subfamily B, bacterial MsbA
VKKPFVIPRFDPRLKAELRRQRRAIILGLLCVLATAILEGATIYLIERSVTSIQQAAPLALTERERERVAAAELRGTAKALAEDLNLSEGEVLATLTDGWRLERQISRQATVERISGTYGVAPADVERILAQSANLPTGNFDAVRRLGFYSLLVVLVFGIKYWFTRGQAYYLSKAAARLATDLRLRLFAKLQRLPVSYFNEKRTGGIYSVLTNDVNVYQNAVQVVRDSIDGPARAMIAFGFIIWIQWQLAVVALLFIPPMAYVIGRNGKKMRKAQAQVQQDLGDVAAMSNEALMGTRVIRAFAAEQQVNDAYARLVDRSYGSQVFAVKRMASLRPMVELIGAAALATVLYICGWLSYGGLLQLGQIAALIYALDRINQGFRSMGSVSNTYNMVQAASDRIYSEVLDVPEPHDADAGQILPDPQGRIEFRNVSFHYPDGTEALRNVSFVLEPGQSLALVGPSGAGKSTLADLLLRFYDPSDGQILFDDVDLRDLKPSWLRRQIGVVPQQTFLFAGTVAENIRLGKRDATDEEIAEAAVAAHAEEFVSTLEKRYDTEVGESGNRLSGGQRQRVAIARALVRKPTLLLLDEATSALDPASEKAVTVALAEIMQSRTTLFIAHRLTTAARADSILVLLRGEVAERGTHAELMEKGGVYAGLFHAFSGGVLA